MTAAAVARAAVSATRRGQHRGQPDQDGGDQQVARRAGPAVRPLPVLRLPSCSGSSEPWCLWAWTAKASSKADTVAPTTMSVISEGADDQLDGTGATSWDVEEDRRSAPLDPDRWAGAGQVEDCATDRQVMADQVAAGDDPALRLDQQQPGPPPRTAGTSRHLPRTADDQGLLQELRQQQHEPAGHLQADDQVEDRDGARRQQRRAGRGAGRWPGRSPRRPPRGGQRPRSRPRRSTRPRRSGSPG